MKTSKEIMDILFEYSKNTNVSSLLVDSKAKKLKNIKRHLDDKKIEYNCAVFFSFISRADSKGYKSWFLREQSEYFTEQLKSILSFIDTDESKIVLEKLNRVEQIFFRMDEIEEEASDDNEVEELKLYEETEEYEVILSNHKEALLKGFYNHFFVEIPEEIEA